MMRVLKRNWQRLHYGIYAASILGVWHWYWQVKRDVREPLTYAALLALLLLARIWHKCHLMWRKSPAPMTPHSGMNTQ
jgi:sulfoxide reductase heme-binding subunit YedZ